MTGPMYSLTVLSVASVTFIADPLVRTVTVIVGVTVSAGLVATGSINGVNGRNFFTRYTIRTACAVIVGTLEKIIFKSSYRAVMNLRMYARVISERFNRARV